MEGDNAAPKVESVKSGHAPQHVKKHTHALSGICDELHGPGAKLMVVGVAAALLLSGVYLDCQHRKDHSPETPQRMLDRMQSGGNQRLDPKKCQWG